MPTTPRLILFHKQKTSGRTRFLRLPEGLLAFAPLPDEARLHEENEPRASVIPHPAMSLKQAENHLGLPPGSLEAEGEFYAEAEVEEVRIPILLAAFTAIDPPFEAVAALGGKFITLTEARGLHPLELELARRAYEVILG